MVSYRYTQIFAGDVNRSRRSLGISNHARTMVEIPLVSLRRSCNLGGNSDRSRKINSDGHVHLLPWSF